MSSATSPNVDARLERAAQLIGRGEALQAEMLLLAVARERPGDIGASVMRAQLAIDRDDTARAAELLQIAEAGLAAEHAGRVDVANLLLQAGHPDRARACVETFLRVVPQHPVGWLLLAHLRDVLGDTHGALKARHQAFRNAHAAGRWLDEASTEPALRNAVAQAGQQLVTERRNFLRAAFETVRAQCGPSAMVRVERALDAYLGFERAEPADARQKPSFLYFPGLDDAPYHDPLRQPWAAKLQSEWLTLRAEAAALLTGDEQFRSFLDFPEGSRPQDYVSGPGGAAGGPAWDAFFFYRHGKRYDDNHALCPASSALLESIELCRIDRIAPEICFSVLRPGSRILPHHGVTNTRLVFHLPLIVPGQCALNIVGVGPHAWREGEPMMFDDTYQHEAWNESGAPRVILLMDCWNPDLTPPERLAVKLLVEAIDEFENRP